MPQTLQIKLLDIGRLLEIFNETCNSLRAADAQTQSLLIVRTANKLIIKIHESIGLLKNEPNVNLRARFHSTLLNYARIYQQIRSSTNAHHLDMGKLETQVYEFINQPFVPVAQQFEAPAFVMTEPAPAPAGNNPAEVASADRTFLNDIMKIISTNFFAIGAYFTNYVKQHFNKPEDYAQTSFWRKAWFWITKSIQLPLLILNDTIELIIRRLINGVFYAIRHPSVVIGQSTFDGYELCNMPDELHDQDVSVDKLYLYAGDNCIEYVVKNPLGQVVRSQVSRDDLGAEHFSAWHEAISKNALDSSIDYDQRRALIDILCQRDHAYPELNRIQYYIKDIDIGFEKFINNIFALPRVIIKPVDTFTGIYLALKNFFKATNKWEKVKETFKQRWAHIINHPLQYTPEVLLLILSIVLPFVVPPAAGGVVGAEFVAKGLGVAAAATNFVPPVLPVITSTVQVVTNTSLILGGVGVAAAALIPISGSIAKSCEPARSELTEPTTVYVEMKAMHSIPTKTTAAENTDLILGGVAAAALTPISGGGAKLCESARPELTERTTAAVEMTALRSVPTETNKAEIDPKTEKFSEQELIETLDIFKQHLRWCDDDPKLFQAVEAEVDRIEKILAKEYPNVQRVSALQEIQNDIVVLQGSLKICDPDEDGELIQLIEAEIIRLNERRTQLQIRQTEQTNLALLPKWERTQVDSLRDTRDGSFSQTSGFNRQEAVTNTQQATATQSLG